MPDKPTLTCTVEALTAYFQFLDDLRTRDVAYSIFRAACYLHDEFLFGKFELCLNQATTVVTAWKDTFSTTETAEQRAAAYLPE